MHPDDLLDPLKAKSFFYERLNNRVAYAVGAETIPGKGVKISFGGSKDWGEFEKASITIYATGTLILRLGGEFSLLEIDDQRAVWLEILDEWIDILVAGARGHFERSSRAVFGFRRQEFLVVTSGGDSVLIAGKVRFRF